MMKYIKPQIEIKEIKLNNDIAASLSDWLQDGAYDEYNLGLTTYSIES